MERIGKLRLSAILIAILVSVGLIWSNVWRPHVPSNSTSIQSQDDRNDELKFRAMQVSLPYQSARGGFIGSTGCRDCHREQFESWHGTFHRTMTQIATCEACHGPGQKHKNFHALSDKRNVTKDPIVHPAMVDSKISNEICGQCHGYFMPPDLLAFNKQGYAYRAGGDLSKTHHMVSYKESLSTIGDDLVPFWKDGTCRISGREYSAQIESACHQSGKMTCLSCHSMHNAPANDMLAKGMESNVRYAKGEFAVRTNRSTSQATGQTTDLSS